MHRFVKKSINGAKLNQVNEIILLRDNDSLAIETSGVDFRLISKGLFIC